MKKNLLLIVVALFSTMMFAQTIDFTKDGRHYYIASPNGKYYVGTVNEGPGCFFNAETKEHLTTDVDSVLLFAVNNVGVACGSRMGQPGVWVMGKDWKMLTALETIDNKPITGGEICGMSADGTKYIALISYGQGNRIPIYYEVDKFENWDDKNAWEFSQLPTPTKENLLYNMAPQFVQVCGMNYDGTRILGRYMLADGKRQVPFIWQLGEDGIWTIKFVAERCLFVEDVVKGTIEMPNREDYVDVTEYDMFRESLETGIIYDLSPYSLFSWTGNGRYIPVSANVLVGDYATYRAAVIDVDRDTLIVFTAVTDAGAVSVNDKGEVMIYTPQTSYFRNSYVATIDNPTEATPLLDYTKQRTDGKIDLAEYMTYERDKDFDGNPIYQVGTGSAIWANEGNAFVTFNYDEVNQMQVPQCFFVRFEEAVSVENVSSEHLTVYPNPTNGVVYFDQELTDVVVYDITGCQVFVQFVAEQSIDLSALNVGTYILTARCNGENVISKVVINR